jgi:hypothetical protein
VKGAPLVLACGLAVLVLAGPTRKTIWPVQAHINETVIERKVDLEPFAAITSYR